jgi:hypothetical protein
MLQALDGVNYQISGIRSGTRRRYLMPGAETRRRQVPPASLRSRSKPQPHRAQPFRSSCFTLCLAFPTPKRPSLGLCLSPRRSASPSDPWPSCFASCNGHVLVGLTALLPHEMSRWSLLTPRNGRARLPCLPAAGLLRPQAGPRRLPVLRVHLVPRHSRLSGRLRPRRLLLQLFAFAPTTCPGLGCPPKAVASSSAAGEPGSAQWLSTQEAAKSLDTASVYPRPHH